MKEGIPKILVGLFSLFFYFVLLYFLPFVDRELLEAMFPENFRLLPHHNNVRTTTVVVVVVHTPHSVLKNDRTRTVSAHLNVLFK